ncbi:hypothetical protein RB195_013589 [Necator americanus]|uniref:Uncharacterized protein n=1 Tax=Necator americanus TaxID=51031 RepID=A0ABR1DW99_NECAM
MLERESFIGFNIRLSGTAHHLDESGGKATGTLPQKNCLFLSETSTVAEEVSKSQRQDLFAIRSCPVIVNVISPTLFLPEFR